jgi:gamma-glutamyltranspeptidase / glutathione hydrolase
MEPFNSRRAATRTRHGMVASSQPLAAQVGLQVLKDGGNAVDAAIAVAAMVNITEPMMNGLGGDSFILVHGGDNCKDQARNDPSQRAQIPSTSPGKFRRPSLTLTCL